MGVWAKLPFALAPGMGINSFFAFSLVLGSGLSWQTALAAVFLSGVIFVLLSVFKIRQLIYDMIPQSLRIAIGVGIGLFIAHIGLQWSGIVVDNPATLVQFGGIHSNTLFFLFSISFLGFLLHRKVVGALLIGIVCNVLVLFVLTQTNMVVFDGVSFPEIKNLVALPDFSGFLQMDIGSVLTIGIILPAFTLLFTDLFDSIATLTKTRGVH